MYLLFLSIFTLETLFLPWASPTATNISGLTTLFCDFGKKVSSFNHLIIMNWQHNENALERQFKFKNFTEAFAFMTEAAFHAERLNHHPYWTNVWNTVSIRLNTHDAGNIVTDLDYQLAAAIDTVFEKYNRS
jgi:4a-hydroxytetrahydrobiopterin dehydratase